MKLAMLLFVWFAAANAQTAAVKPCAAAVGCIAAPEPDTIADLTLTLAATVGLVMWHRRKLKRKPQD